jgi:hypothetical protein
MANQVAARLGGDDYQHLYSWLYVLELRMPAKQVGRVRVEDEDAGSIDDITVQYESGSDTPSRYYQIKFHVDQRRAYSTESLIDHAPTARSLLRKMFDSWRRLVTARPTVPVELYLVSNWAWDSADKLKSCISGRNGALTDDFSEAGPKSDIGALRQRWQSHLGIPTEEFIRFSRTIRFRLGAASWEELKDRVAERMANLGLKSDETTLVLVAGIVREWIKANQNEVTREVLEKTVMVHDLQLPQGDQPSVTVYLTTIKEQRFEIAPDYALDWRDYFVGSPGMRAHAVKNPTDWNDVLLPQLWTLEKLINGNTSCRFVRVRGLARLSAWFAFGYVFSEVNRYTLEVDQHGALWRSDVTPSTDLRLVTCDQRYPEGERVDGEGTTVAVGISVSGLLDADVTKHLASRSEKVVALLLLRPDRELNRFCLRGAADAVALADAVKTTVREFVKRWEAQRLLLYYFGPLSGACFIGHRLNAVCREIVIMEDQQPGYAPSFVLT